MKLSRLSNVALHDILGVQRENAREVYLAAHGHDCPDEIARVYARVNSRIEAIFWERTRRNRKGRALRRSLSPSGQ